MKHYYHGNLPLCSSPEPNLSVISCCRSSITGEGGGKWGTVAQMWLLFSVFRKQAILSLEKFVIKPLHQAIHNLSQCQGILERNTISTLNKTILWDLLKYLERYLYVWQSLCFWHSNLYIGMCHCSLNLPNQSLIRWPN